MAIIPGNGHDVKNELKLLQCLQSITKSYDICFVVTLSTMGMRVCFCPFMIQTIMSLPEIYYIQFSTYFQCSFTFGGRGNFNSMWLPPQALTYPGL